METSRHFASFFFFFFFFLKYSVDWNGNTPSFRFNTFEKEPNMHFSRLYKLQFFYVNKIFIFIFYIFLLIKIRCIFQTRQSV